jgi:hypothetical protein
VGRPDDRLCVPTSDDPRGHGASPDDSAKSAC